MPGRAPTIHIREAEADELVDLHSPADADAGARARPHPQRPQRRRWLAERGTRCVASLDAELHPLIVDRDAIPSAHVDLLGTERSDSSPELWAELAEVAREALAAAGIIYIYRVAPPSLAARRALGLTVIGRYLERSKALRPLSLLAARLGHPPLLDRAAASLDSLLGLPLRAPGWQPRQLERGHSIVELSLVDDAPALVGLLTRAARGGVARGWTAAELVAAYGPSATLLAQTHSGVIVAFVAYRVEQREGRAVATVLDLVARDDELGLYASLLRAVERRVRERAALLTLLDHGSPGLRKAARRAGFVDDRHRWVLAADRLDRARPQLPPGARWRLGLIDAHRDPAE